MIKEQDRVQGAMADLYCMLISLQYWIKTDTKFENLSDEEQLFQHVIQYAYKDAYNAMKQLNNSDFNINFWSTGSMDDLKFKPEDLLV